MILDLCRELGKTQKELLNPETGLDKEDLLEWMAYKQIKPFGYDEERRRIGMICAAVSNSAGKTYKDNVEWTDFFRPSWEEFEEKPKSKFDFDTFFTVFTGAAVPIKKDDKQKVSKGK